MLLSHYKSFEAKSLSASNAHSSSPDLTVRRLGLQEYEPLWNAMRYRIEHSSADRNDEIWLLSHKPIFTLGQAGKEEHILSPGDIPVLQIDRGGQVTYHGPGQLVVYLLVNVKRRKLGVRDLVNLIEAAIIDTLAELGIDSTTIPKAPGVYVNDAKIAALGLRIKNGWSYHGLSLNVRMDLSPFKSINPCGFEGLEVTQIADLIEDDEDLMQRVSKMLCDKLLTTLDYAAHYSS